MIRKYNVKVNGEQYEVEVELIDSGSSDTADTPVRQILPGPVSISSPSVSEKMRGTPETGIDIGIKAPVPGTVLRVNVRPGDQIKRGQCLLVLEAMKMENEIDAPEDGTVSIVCAGDGNSVAADEILLYYRK